MAFVVPAEIGHAPYAVPVLEFLLNSFSNVHVIAVREKLFPRLSEDCWLLYCEDRNGRSREIHFSKIDSFVPSVAPPASDESIDWADLKTSWTGRLRPFLLPREARSAYLATARRPDTVRLGDFAKVGIGYITGDNDFFHLSPSEIQRHQIPPEMLTPTVRRGRCLKSEVIDHQTVRSWEAADEACYLLKLPPAHELPDNISRYLDSERGREARQRYKCRIRPFWYSVPSITRPDYFLQCMSGSVVKLARNDAGAACTNSILAMHITDRIKASSAIPRWSSVLTKLSCELDGHPLGGGMLKLEPREAARLLFAPSDASHELFEAAIGVMKLWRHVSSETD
ncbi:hypothetical protein CPY51_30420 [Rhizobium tubonense]|uniref:Type II methyltransferase M.Eco57I C-terminal domain-containing protein n=2 Tax=Rhizobium tubonense TaxID=484088 RepID=A0A2W4C4T6_9HYPH|nr:hypothetical protein CPY51_30420 [Rhizobium tubonense]